jgi:hypothetical protein
MAVRDGKRQAPKAGAGRRLLMGVGAGAGVFLAAAAMATGSAVTAAPAHADFEDLLDPIIQPLLSSLTDSLTAFDPSAAADITSWTDSLLSSLGSFDLALPSTDSALAAAASSAEPAASATTGTYDLPLKVLEGTEPTVQATIDGSSTSVPLLIDTGSSGLVIPDTDLGSNFFSQLEALSQLGTPTGLSESGYSGGVEYFYLTYNDVPVTYDGGLTTDGPVDIEVYSYDPSNFLSFFTNDAFQNFLGSNAVNGVLGIGENTAGPTTSPFESFGNVTVDISNPTAGTGELIVGGDPVSGTSLTGAPVSTEYISIDGGPLQAVLNDVDSGGVTGTIPASLLTSSEYNSTTDLVNPNTTIALYADKAGTEELYQYTVTAANDPFVVSGTDMDSGVEPFLLGPISTEYTSGTGTTFFG